MGGGIGETCEVGLARRGRWDWCDVGGGIGVRWD